MKGPPKKKDKKKKKIIFVTYLRLDITTYNSKGVSTIILVKILNEITVYTLLDSKNKILFLK
jgi:hypothetical protein